MCNLVFLASFEGWPKSNNKSSFHKRFIKLYRQGNVFRGVYNSVPGDGEEECTLNHEPSKTRWLLAPDKITLPLKGWPTPSTQTVWAYHFPSDRVTLLLPREDQKLSLEVPARKNEPPTPLSQRSSDLAWSASLKYGQGVLVCISSWCNERLSCLKHIVDHFWWRSFEFFTMGLSVILSDRSLQREEQKKSSKIASSGVWNQDLWIMRPIPYQLSKVNIQLPAWIFMAFIKSCSIDSRNE